MRQPTDRTSAGTVLVLHGTSIAALAALIVIRWRVPSPALDLSLLLVAVAGAIATTLSARVLFRERRERRRADRSLVAERERASRLEGAISARSAELEDARRALSRMWRLGQQITFELNPRRVLGRFLDAISDVVRANGALVVLLREDSGLKVSAAVGSFAGLVGSQMPLVGTIVGTVIRTGKYWISDGAGLASLDTSAIGLPLPIQSVRTVAIIPVTRRGERIGAVLLGFEGERRLSPQEFERIEALIDILSVSLENAELVETLRQTEWRFRTLFLAAPDAVMTILRTGQIGEANDAVRDLTDNEPAAMTGKEAADLVIDQDRERFLGALESAFEGQPQRLEVAFRLNSKGAPGSENARERGQRIAALAMSRLPEAEPASVLMVARDMTADREMRARMWESDRLAAVGELVAGVAHEVNNPLGSIAAFSQLLLRDDALTPEQRDSVEVIKAETLRASQVVKDLLAFARRSEPEREPLDLNLVIARTLRLRDYQLSSNKIKVEQSLAHDLPAVIGDSRQIQQVFLNLVTNAIQAMTTLGGGTFFVTTRSSDGKVVVEMHDTGPGVPEHARARIFEPFFTTKREGEGTGLGLSVSYGIMVAHGGSIELAQTSAAGTTFRVTMPAADTARPTERGRVSAPVSQRSPIAGIRLLFVDDEPMLRSSMQAFGELRGFTVVVACDGIEALAVVRATPVDAVVCDIRMPGMDGIAFHERLRHDRPGLATRTVFVTGDVVSPTGRTAAARQPVLHKPFTFEKLEEAVSAVMRGVPLQSQAGASR